MRGSHFQAQSLQNFQSFNLKPPWFTDIKRGLTLNLYQLHKKPPWFTDINRGLNTQSK